MQGLGGAFGKQLEQNQICLLAGEASAGFQVLSAAGVTEVQLAEQLKGLLQSGLSIAEIRSQLNADVAECIR